MKPLSLLILVVLLAGLAGCAASRPLTDSEFRGFCYTNIGRKVSCDTIELCNEYDSDVLSVEHASRADCARGCENVYNRQYVPSEFIGCGSTVLTAYNWCVKYCNTNYPQ
ncbi:hypothetical protein [Solidesulfovibrio sp.]|uniref:hypothetical protein n=1 Tax=Solidesulfovibrio sp. TaxID=2910990 RepID=UPI0026175A6F|nr:hypothetical protein [Solidesulfovibrio sp.]